MGEGRKEALRVEFDRSLKVEFHGANVTSDAGLLAFRELDEALGLTGMVAALLADMRTGLNTRHTLLGQFRQSLYSRLAGYEDTNDAERLCLDPSIRQVVGERAKEHKAASTSQMGRFETDVLYTVRERERKDSWPHYSVGTPRKRVRSTLRKSKSGQATCISWFRLPDLWCEAPVGTRPGFPRLHLGNIG